MGKLRIERQPHIYTRLVINGHIGIITLEAMAWMHDYGLEWVCLYRDKGAIGMSRLGEGNPELWRAQIVNENLGISRMLLAAKLESQVRTMELLRNTDTAKMIRGYSESLAFTDTVSTMLAWEGHAAKAYWKAWDTVFVPFIADHLTQVPPRWMRFSERPSLIMPSRKSNRNATDPVNALLNYAYKIGETLAIQACYATGLSPLLGLSHTKQYRRDRDGRMPRPSMALDLLESVRPACDRVVLALLDYGQGIVPYLRWHDFLELADGSVRVESAELRTRIIEEVFGLDKEVVSWAQAVRDMLRQ